MHTSTFHKSHSIRKFTRKMPRPRAPWSSTGLYSYRKKPSVWTRCLGNQTSAEHNVDTYTRAASVVCLFTDTSQRTLCISACYSLSWFPCWIESCDVTQFLEDTRSRNAQMHRMLRMCETLQDRTRREQHDHRKRMKHNTTEERFKTSAQEQIYRKSARAQNLGTHFAQACTIECTSTCHIRPTLHTNLQGKCRGPEPRTTLCQPARHFIWKCTGKIAAAQNLGPHFVRACAV